jgi:hypothetical protein
LIRVILPYHLRNLAKVDEVQLTLGDPVTARSILDELESRYPALRGTLRDYATEQRRPLIRFFVCESDWSYESLDRPLPTEVAQGKEPFWIVGAVAGG